MSWKCGTTITILLSVICSFILFFNTKKVRPMVINRKITKVYANVMNKASFKNSAYCLIADSFTTMNPPVGPQLWLTDSKLELKQKLSNIDSSSKSSRMPIIFNFLFNTCFEYLRQSQLRADYRILRPPTIKQDALFLNDALFITLPQTLVIYL